MPQNALQICNSALIKLGTATIGSFSDDSKECRLVRERYPACRNMMLRGHVWAFSKNVVNLPALVGAPPVDTWQFRIQLPVDLARILSVKHEECPEDFERVGEILYTHIAPITLRYVKNYDGVTDSFAFPDDFAEALAFYLAADLAFPLMLNPSLAQQNFGLYNDSIRSARFNGAVELPALPYYNDWIAAHQGLYWDDINPELRGLAGY